MGKSNEAIDACDHAYKLNNNNMDVLLRKATILENREELEAALRELRTIEQNDPHFHEIDKKIERMEKLIKAKKNRNYWKILGLKRNASDKEIKKAYKKLAILYHPDRCGQNDQTTDWSAAKCEEEFRNIADAKEVLTNDEMRKLYDQGVDPMDPESKQEHERSQHGHGFPFGGGFHGGPFGGGGFRQQGGGGGGFKFKFNF